jgi:hypothetical protein
MADAALREEALQIECTERGGFVRALYAGRFDRGFPAKHYFLAKDMRLTSRDKIDTLVHRITCWVAKRYG